MANFHSCPSLPVTEPTLFPLVKSYCFSFYFLEIDNNKLTGTIPTELGNMIEIEQLLISKHYMIFPILNVSFNLTPTHLFAT